MNVEHTVHTQSHTQSHKWNDLSLTLSLSNTLNFCIPFYFPSNELYRDNVRGALSHSDRISHFMPFAVAEFRIGKKLNGFFAFPFHSLSLLSLFKCGKCSLHTSVCVCVSVRTTNWENFVECACARAHGAYPTDISLPFPLPLPYLYHSWYHRHDL